MKKAAAHTTTLTHGNHTSSASVHSKTLLLDTVWRVTAPVAVGTCAGIFADSYFETKPWLALLGVMAGFVVAGILVKRQIGDLPDDEK